MAVRLRYVFITLAVIAVLGISVIGALVWWVFSAIDQAGNFASPPDELKNARVLTGEDLLNRQEFFKLKAESILGIILGSITELDEVKRQQKAQSAMAKKFSGFDSSFYDAKNDEIIFTGVFGAEVLDREGKEKREILFQPVVNKVKVGWYEAKNFGGAFKGYKAEDLNNDGNYEFIGYGGMGGLAVFDKQGNGLWRYGKLNIDVGELLDKEKIKKTHDQFVDIKGAAAGDLDGDGISEVVCTTFDKELIAFDDKGNEKWRREDKFPGSQLWIIDMDGDKKAEIIEADYSAPKIKDSNGFSIKELPNAARGESAFFIADDGKKKKLNFIDFTGGQLLVTGEDGNLIWQAGAPFSEIKDTRPDRGSKQYQPEEPDMPDNVNEADASRVEGYDTGAEPYMHLYPIQMAQVKLKVNEPKYLAILGNFMTSSRAMLYVYSPDGKLVYNEILPEESKTIMALPAGPGGAGGAEEILVGGTHTIWRYSLK
jgi:hypothetical protein